MQSRKQYIHYTGSTTVITNQHMAGDWLASNKYTCHEMRLSQATEIRLQCTADHSL